MGRLTVKCASISIDFSITLKLLINLPSVYVNPEFPFWFIPASFPFVTPNFLLVQRTLNFRRCAVVRDKKSSENVLIILLIIKNFQSFCCKKPPLVHGLVNLRKCGVFTMGIYLM